MGGDNDSIADVQHRLDELAERVETNCVDIDALTSRADASDRRSEAADARADEIETRARVDRDMIAELKAEGLLSREHIAQLEQALKSSRTIGAAIGMIMATREVREDQAFAILRNASQNSNRKLRDLAEELVTAGARAGAARAPGRRRAPSAG